MGKSYFANLKEGIENRDWSLVEEAYEALTGSRVTAKKVVYTEEDEEDRNERMGIARTNADLSRGEDSNGEKKSRTMPIEIQKINLFNDDGTLYTDLKQSKAEKSKFERAIPPRPKAKTRVVQCKFCKEKAFLDVKALPVSFEENGQSKIAEYVCGKCISKKKG